MFNKNRITFFALLVAVSLLLCGCGSGQSDNSGLVTKSSNSNFEASHTEVSSDDELSVTTSTTTSVSKTDESKPTEQTSSEKKPQSVVTTAPTQSITPTATSTTPQSEQGTSSVTTQQTPQTTVSTKIPTRTETEHKLPVETPEAIDYTKLLLANVGANELEIYDRIMNAVTNFEQTVNFPYAEATQKQVEDCLLLLSFTALEYNYVSTRYVITVDEYGYVTKLMLEYTRTSEQYAAELNRLREVVKEIVAGCTAHSDFDKVVYVHDQIVKRCRYDAEGANILSAYGCLVEGRAVCEGYAKAFVTLCAELGIESVPVIGTTTTDGVSESHMWNLVRIDGEWYHVDATWDDPITKIGDDFVKYDYFALSDSEIRLDHSTTDIPYFTYPLATASKGDYFKRGGLLCGTAEQAIEVIKNELQEACIANERFVRIKVSDDGEFKKLCNMLFEPQADGRKKIFSLLRELSFKIDNKDFNPGRYSKMLNEDKNILTIILSYE